MAFIDACGLSPRLTACRLTTVTGSHQAKERFQLFADERERKRHRKNIDRIRERERESEISSVAKGEETIIENDLRENRRTFMWRKEKCNEPFFEDI